MNNMASGRRQWLAERPYIFAVVIAVALVLWMLSGMLSGSAQATEEDMGAGIKEAIIPKVQIDTRFAENVSEVIELYGRTEPDRITTLKAEVRGKIAAVFAERGSQVKQGQVIVKIALNDLKAQLAHSKALLKQREIEHRGAKKLHAKGHQGEADLARTFADLEAAKAEIARLEIDIENTVIRAPFDGVLNTRMVEVGDYVASGDDIAVIADLDPLVVRAYATENQVPFLTSGKTADVRLLGQELKQGTIRYIASVADEATNTFKIEVTLDNSDYQTLAGVSSEVSIAMKKLPAVKVSPALLALDEAGNVGIKSVVDDIVVFTPINIVKSESDGIWLSGLGEQADIITLGQGFVRAGDKVEAVKAQVR
ncbi:efflux RND transporter periplasmic adaptor subunit [Thalassomonas haliotis]|nr:efflux RND transporter periplasmic adaptor subunit [Thalassomonas haliotis]